MTEVKLHAYALSGIAGWHVGVEVYGWEYYFDGYNDPVGDPTAGFKGVLSCDPGTWAGKTGETAALGMTKKNENEVQAILQHLRKNEYTEGLKCTPTNYKLATHNCQDFAESFCNHLGCERVPTKYTQLKNALRGDVSKFARDIFGGKGPRDNLVVARLGDVPAGWGVHIYTYTAADTFHAASYWHEWLTTGEKRVSAGQKPQEEFCITIHDGRGRCLTGDHACMAGDVLEISYRDRWHVAHYRAGEKLYDRQSER